MGADYAVIVNPTAGHGRAGRIWPEVAKTMGRLGIGFDVQTTGGPGEATRFAAEAQRAGYSSVVAMGGDGTVSEVVNGLFAEGQPTARLGVLSSGPGSDLVRTLGIPRGVAGVEALTGESRVIDVGLVTTRTTGTRRYFVNAGDVGLGAEAAERVNRSTKLLGGFASFLIGAITTIIEYQPIELEIGLDGSPPSRRKAPLVVVANGRCFAGGMRIAPRAELDDGLFDVVMLDDVPKLELIGRILPAVYSGTHVNHPKVTCYTARTVAITPVGNARLELDGEVVGPGAVDFSLIPRSLTVLAPGRSPG